MPESEGRLAAPPRDAIGVRLRSMRERYGLTGQELASRLGCGQARISKIESGRLKPSVELVRQMSEALDLPKAEAKELETLTGVFLLEIDRWNLSQPGAALKVQKAIAELENQARRIRGLDWFVLSGLLQTRRYTTCLFNTFREMPMAQLRAVVQLRMNRQRLLRSQRKKFTFVIAEHALLVNFCPRQVVLEQLDKLDQIARRPNIVLRVLPMSAPIRVVPVSGFDIIDDCLVLIESRDFQVRVWDDREVRGYISDFELLEQASTQSLGETRGALAAIRRRVCDHWDGIQHALEESREEG